MRSDLVRATPFLIALALVACDPSVQSSKPKAEVAVPAAVPLSPDIALTPDTLAGGIKFYEEQLPQYVTSVRGLASAESFGRWSIGKLVLIDFVGGLPTEFDLELVLGGFGPNVGSDLQVIVGAQSKTLRIKSDLMQMQSYQLRFSNPEGANSVALVIPAPTSPQAIGKAVNDPRMLGISLQSLLIRPIVPSEPSKK